MIRSVVKTSVSRRVTVLMVSLAVVAFGAVSLSRLPINLLPNISYPSLTVQTEYPNAAPGEVENLVTKPVEDAVGVLRGLREIHSVSRAGMSEVTLEFGWGSDMNSLAMDVREKIDRLTLPEETESPIVLRYDPALDPIMRIALSGSTDLRFMRTIADQKLKDEFGKLEGVASAQVKGGEEEEIQVNVNQGRLTQMGLSPSDLATVLSGSNINRPGGSLESETSQFMVRTLNEYDSLEEIGNLVITAPGSAPVRLNDVASVVMGSKDRDEITRVNGEECVIIEIYKEADANTVAVADSVTAALEWMPRFLTGEMHITPLFDQSRFIRQSISEVQQALLIGGLLAVAVLWLFLRDNRATLIIATSIPISVIATFILMHSLDVSLNIMSLGGLTLGIGMLVDSSIVVLESIHRFRQTGMSQSQAAIEGTLNVGGAVVASILTTIAVFFPIVFVEGIAGQLFRDQALTVTFSLAASLVVALTLIPMLASWGGKKANAQSEQKGPDPSSRWTGSYEWLLRGALRHRLLMILAVCGLFVASLFVSQGLGRELIPSLSEGEFFFEVTMPEGTALPATDREMKEMEAIAQSDERVRLVYSSVGTRSVSGGLSLKTKDENLAQLNVVMADRSDELMQRQTENTLRQSFSRRASVESQLGRPSFFSLKTPLELHFFGEDLDQLKQYSEDIKSKLEQIDGITDLRASLESGNPELNVVFNRARLSRLGLTVDGVSSTLQSRVDGTIVSRFKEDDRLIDIRLRNQIEDRNTRGDIENMVVAIRDGQPVTLNSVAQVNSGRGPSEIHRIGQSRVAILFGEVEGRSLGAVMDEVKQVISENPSPVNISPALGGQNREMEESFDSLIFAIGLSVFLVYLVMASTFESLIHPFVIMFTIPFALIGAIAGLRAANLSISIIALLGVIFLVGVIVNNAIVLVDAVNHLRRTGMEKLDAVVAASKLRLRPIVMTTMTTVLGLLPMAIGFGEGAELRQPLAVVVTYGLIVGTFLTLFVIPAVYLMIPSTVRSIKDDEELDRILAMADTASAIGESP